tara:strand:- start:3382 stop:4272 length:891 start_codon:yes stop_codon:yes gene_type:complete
MSKKMADRLPPSDRIIVIGDLHGDWQVTKEIFLKSNLIDLNFKWIAEPKNTIVVQVGDIVDRGGRPDNIGDECSEMKIMDFLDECHSKAKLYGGGVYCILGNHEIMNVVGNFTYSSPMSIKCFGGPEERKNVFKPGGILARRFACSRNVVLIVGGFLFVHAGIMPKHLTKNIKEINDEMRDYLNTSGSQYSKEFSDYFLAYEGILWNRELAIGNPDCNKLKKVLNHFKVGSMVVGHTVQDQGINSKCENKIWKVDTGMSDAFGTKGKIQVLEILDNGISLPKNNNKPFRIITIRTK